MKKDCQCISLHIDLTNLFKIVQHFSACNTNNVLNFYHACHKTRGHRLNLFHATMISTILNTFLPITSYN